MRRNQQMLRWACVATIAVGAITTSCSDSESSSHRETRNAAIADSAFGFPTVQGGYQTFSGRRLLSCFDATHCAAIINATRSDGKLQTTVYFGSGSIWQQASGGDVLDPSIQTFGTSANCISIDQCVVLGGHLSISGPTDQQSLGWHGYTTSLGSTTAPNTSTIQPWGDYAYNDSTTVYDSRCFPNSRCIGFGKYHPASPLYGFDKRYMDQATPMVVDGTKDQLKAERVTFAVAGMNYTYQRLECASENFCVAVGEYDEQNGARSRVFYVPYLNGKWDTTARVIPFPSDALDFPFMRMTDVACAPGGSCHVVGGYKGTTGNFQFRVDITSNGNVGTVGKFADSYIEGFLISCGTKDSCVATNGSIEYLMTGDKWATSSSRVGAGSLDGRLSPPQLVCTTATTCLLVARSGMVKRSSKGWASPVQIPQSQQTITDGLVGSYTVLGVACPTTTTCLLFGYAAPQGRDDPAGHHPAVATVSLEADTAVPTSVTATSMSTSPPTTASSSTSTTTTVPSDPTSGSDDGLTVSTRSTRTFAAVASVAGLQAPKGSTIQVTVSSASKSLCSTKKTSVVFTKVGRCRLRVSVKPKTGAAKRKSVTFTVVAP